MLGGSVDQGPRDPQDIDGVLAMRQHQRVDARQA
jgi:hypothetical protein